MKLAVAIPTPEIKTPEGQQSSSLKVNPIAWRQRFRRGVSARDYGGESCSQCGIGHLL